ncbi:hypothetical protein [Aliiroseovarius crassostreae]|uniref:hypothetical protein n=1 Tax=Aliiroseovarius crassostreae TaxID=154981 RepID=UPI002206D806|nr:hypothetical protein [Aliiroseovarius crassostreae]UWP99646.1 hypothetical protein K3X53_05820 [Aliiroseovarius crassostreae]
MTSKALRRNLIFGLICVAAAVPLYFLARANREWEWLFNCVGMLGGLVLLWQVITPLIFTYFQNIAPDLLHRNLRESELFQKLFILNDKD